MRTVRTIQMGLLLAGLLAVGGCLQLETTLSLRPDGSATITERLQFSQRLLDLSAAGGGQAKIAGLLEEAAARDRMTHMGKGVTLVSHQVRPVGGARESVTVFNVPDIRDFRYASPFLAYSDYPENCILKADMFPVYESTWYGREAGQMAVTFTPLKPPKVAPAKPAPAAPANRSGGGGRNRAPGKPEEVADPGPPPADMQMARNLLPLVRDLLADAKIKVTFESYAPLRFRMYFRYRDGRAGTHRFDLVDFSDKDLDQFGMNLVDNEEVMLELIRGQLDGPNFLEAVKEHGTNMTLTVFHPRGIPEIYFRPSAQMFKTYFEGKTLKFDKREGGDRPARFEEIGWKPGDQPTTRPEDQAVPATQSDARGK